MDTPRLRLRPVAAGDAPALLALWSQPAVARVLFPREPATLDRVERWVARSVAEPPRVFVVEPRAGGALLGYAGIQPLPESGEPELFYGLAQEAWGRGYATEAGRVVLAHARHALGVDRVVAVVSPENPRSARVLEKLGFERDGQMAHAGLPHDRFVLHL